MPLMSSVTCAKDWSHVWFGFHKALNTDYHSPHESTTHAHAIVV